LFSKTLNSSLKILVALAVSVLFTTILSVKTAVFLVTVCGCFLAAAIESWVIFSRFISSSEGFRRKVEPTNITKIRNKPVNVFLSSIYF
jgi:hypothetical protein